MSEVRPRGRLGGGYANDLYAVECDGRACVVRVQPPPFRPDALLWEARLLRELEAALPEVRAPIPTRTGTTFFLHREAAVQLFDYVDAAPTNRQNPLESDEAAVLLGRLHAAAAGLDLPQRPGATPLKELGAAIADARYFEAIGHEVRPFPAALEKRRREIDWARTWALAQVDEAKERSPAEGLVHGDFFRGNVLVRDGRAAALVDWEEARIDWTLFDVSSGMWEFSKNEAGTQFDERSAQRFLESYRAAGGTLPASEEDLLLPFIRVRRILEVLRAPYDRHVDWAYQLANLEAFANLG